VWAALLSAAALAAVLGTWFATGWRSVGAEAAQLAAAPSAEAARRAALLASELGARLEEMRAAEDGRPYYEYQNLYHDPRGASEGQSVVPSPLARGPGDPLIAVHFQIAADGRVTVPTINEEVPELSAPGRLERDRAALAALRARAGQLRTRLHARAVEAPVRPPARPPRQQVEQAQQQAPQVQAFDPSVYAQNASPNQVYQAVQAQQRKGDPVRPRPARAAAPVDVRIARLAWRTAELDGAARLLALRAVDTPDGTITQGFAVASEAIASWLVQRAGDLPAALVVAPPDGGRASAPVTGTTWHVAVDPGPALQAAAIAGGDLRRGFLWRFFPAAALALVCGVLVVLLVARADHLARQRSDFAAAAAHELRTPLAGLALYGDMLAERLGNMERQAVYAQRISDEAGRLGRVVGNVLGFTQLDRRGLTVHPRDGDAAQVVRDALDHMRPALEHAALSVEADMPDSAPARFDADAVARILQNLLDNAEKYSRGAGDRTVKVSVRSTADGVTIDVADRGPGVPRQLRRRLFRAFERGGGDGPAGLGLGLTLARALARAMDGDLVHSEREGGGAVFSLRLPHSKPT
jgi:signal transduction histidine kinase